MEITPELITAIAALLGAIFAIYKSLRSTRRDDAGQDAATAKSYAETAKTYSDALKDSIVRVDALEEEVKKLRDEQQITRSELKRRDIYIAYLLGGITALHKQLMDIDQPPCWSPETIEKQVP